MTWFTTAHEDGIIICSNGPGKPNESELFLTPVFGWLPALPFRFRELPEARSHPKMGVFYFRSVMGKKFKVQPLNGDKSYYTDYKKYIRSFHWNIRADYLKGHAGDICQECGLPDGRFANGRQVFLNVHHKHYRTLGKEKPRDVQILCNPCHKKKHKRWL